MKAQTIVKKAKGFTLVELLVVIAIIGLLAAIGIPAILNAQRASRNTTRLKQLEAVRNAMADYYTKYNVAPSIFATSSCSGQANSSTTVYVGESTSGRCSRAISVDMPTTDGYSLTFNSGCNSVDYSGDNSKIIKFDYNSASGTITLCREPSGQETMQFK